jgi:hypothetical protein
MTTITLPATSATEGFLDAIATAWEFFKLTDQVRETFDSLASTVREFIPLVTRERRLVELALEGGSPTHLFRPLAGRADQLADRATKLLEIRSQLATLGTVSEQDLLVFDRLHAEVTALQRLYAAVFHADRSIAPAEFWQQAEEATSGPFEPGGEILARLQAGGEI